MLVKCTLEMKNSARSASSLLSLSRVVFWDFDGVIKDSVDIKTQAYLDLFLPFGNDLSYRIRQHHESNGGISRFEKLPLYLRWAGMHPEPQLVRQFCERFSQLIVEAVIESPWVPGVLDYFHDYADKQCFVLVTATPQAEIEHILSELNITQYFREVHGAPTKKSNSIGEVLARLKYDSDMALMIGDSLTDLRAAQDNSVAFLLRRTPLNRSLQDSFTGPMFDDFCYA